MFQNNSAVLYFMGIYVLWPLPSLQNLNLRLGHIVRSCARSVVGCMFCVSNDAKKNRRLRRTRLETEGLRASQPVSKKLGSNPALSFQRLVSKARLRTVPTINCHLHGPEAQDTVYQAPSVGGYKRTSLIGLDRSPVPQAEKSKNRANFAQFPQKNAYTGSSSG